MESLDYFNSDGFFTVKEWIVHKGIHAKRHCTFSNEFANPSVTDNKLNVRRHYSIPTRFLDSSKLSLRTAESRRRAGLAAASIKNYCMLGDVHCIRPPLVRAIKRTSRPADYSPMPHRHRDRHRRRPRHIPKLGRGRSLSRARAVVLRRIGNTFGQFTNGNLNRQISGVRRSWAAVTGVGLSRIHYHVDTGRLRFMGRMIGCASRPGLARSHHCRGGPRLHELPPDGGIHYITPARGGKP